jgi:ABC-type Fe3+-hydroxamate transport system substrate-binding protein
VAEPDLLPRPGARGDAARGIVSLVPSVTETLLSWGIVPVAVTRFCEQPHLAAVGGTKDPDVAAIVALAPDLVVVNDEENRREDADALRDAGLAIHVTSIHGLDEVDACLDLLAAAVGVERPPAERAAFQRIAVDVVRRPGARRRRAFVPVWRRPWMTMNASTYGSSVLAHLGIDNVFAAAADRYPTVDLDDVVGRRPDLVLLPSEPYPFGSRHVAELVPVGADVRLVDGQDLFWWGSRTPAALIRLGQSIGA